MAVFALEFATIAQLHTLLAKRYISLASIIAALAFPLVLILAILLAPTWNLANLWPLLIAATVIPLMVVIRHRENIKRLLAGTESKVLKS